MNWIILPLLTTLFYTPPSPPLEVKTHDFTKAIATIQMFEANHLHNKYILRQIHQSTHTLKDLNLSYLPKSLKSLRPKNPQITQKAWTQGTEKALFLLDYGSQNKIIEAYSQSINAIINLSTDPILFPKS